MTRSVNFLVLPIFFLCVSISANSQSEGDYRSKVTGIWSATSTWQRFDGSNWLDAETPPLTEDTANTVTVTNTHQVTVSNDLIVNHSATLAVSGTMIIDDGVDLTVHGTLNLLATLTGSGTALINGPMNWTNGTVSINLTISSTATLTMSSSNSKKIESKTIINQGTINWSDGPFSFANGKIQNEKTFIQTVDRPFSTLGGIDLFTNTATGTFTKSAGALITQIDVPVSNAGIININSGTLSFNRTTTHTGTINTFSGATLRTTGGFTDNGTINIVSGAAFSNELNIFTQNNLITFSGTANINNNATWNVNVSQVLNSTTSFFHSGRLGGTSTITVNGPMTWAAGTIAINLTLSSSATMTMSTANTKTIESKTIKNQGTINWTDGPFSFANGTIQNENVFNQSVDRPFSTLGGVDLFTNTASGTFTKSASAGITQIDVPVSNAGIININSGTLSFNRATTHIGTINTFSGTTLRNTGDFTDNGTINIVSGVLFTIEGTAVFTENNLINFSGTVNINNNATWNVNVLQVLNSTTSFYHSGRLGGTSTLTVNGPMTWAAGTVAVNLTLSATATLTMSTANTKTIESKTIKNQGTINWSDGPFSFANGTIQNENAFNQSVDRPFSTLGGIDLFNNTATGTFTKSSGVGITHIDVPVNNAGIININSGTLSFNRTTTHTGTINTVSDTKLRTTGGFTDDGTINIVSGATFSNEVDVFTQNNLINFSGTVNINNNATWNVNVLQVLNSTTSFYHSGRLGGTSTLTVNGPMTWAAGTVAVNLTLSATATLTMSTTNTKTIESKTIKNQGTINWTDGTFSFANGTIQNENAFNQSIDKSFNTLGGTDLFNNTATGTFTKSASGLTNIDVPVTNAGIIKGTGTLSFNKEFTNTGIMAPGLSPGILTINGTAPFSSNSTLSIEIKDASGAGTGHDQLQRAGDLTLAGTLTVIETGTVPSADYTIISLTSGTISGTFATTNLPNGYTLNQTSTTVALTKQVAVTPSDYRSKQSGNWQLASTWERFDGTNWVSAITSPSSSDGIITILNLHQVTVLNSIDADQLIVNTGATLTVISTGTLTINNDSGSDLTVNGTVNLSGVLTGNGTAQVNGIMNWTGGIVGVDLTITSTGLLAMSTSNTKTLQSKNIINQGTINWSDGNFNFSSAALQNDNVFNQSVDRPFTSLGTLDIFFNSTTGTFTKSALGITNIDVAVTNRGTFKGTGTLSFNEAFTNTGIVAPGLSPGILTVNGTAPFSSNSTLRIEIMNASGAGTGHDQLQRAGNLTLAGTLTVVETGIVPNGDYIIISLSSGTISGSFATTNLPAGYTLSQTSTTVALTKQVTVTPSDYRSKQSGNWTLASTWERFDGTNWVDAITPPSSSDAIITILNTHQVTILNSIAADQLIVNTGATLSVITTGTLTINDGTGSDLTVNGNVNLSSGVLTGNGTAQVNGIMNWTGGIVAVDLTITSTGMLAMSTSNTKTLQSKNIINQGTINWSDGNFNFSSAALQNDNVFNQSVDRPFTSLGILDIFFNSTTGTFTKSVLGITNIDVAVTNRGTFKGTGTLSFNEAFTNTGIVAPGLSPGILTVNGTAPFSSNSTLNIEIMNASGAGTGHDQLQRAGNLTLAGTITVVETGIVPNGDYIIISLSSGTISGSFSSTNLPPDYLIIYNSNSVVARKGQVICVPAVSITAAPGNTICAGTNVTFTATPTNGGTPSYQWKLNGNNVGTNSTTYSNNTLANGDVVTVLMTSSLACANPTTATSTGITMSVSSKVAPSVSIAANPGNTICAGTNVTFTATPTNGGIPLYQWKLNGNNVGTNSNTYSNNTLANGDVVTVVITSSLACANPTTTTSTGIAMSVSSTVAPLVSIAANPGNTICAGTNVTFTATPTNGGTPSYQWKLNGNNVGTNSNTYSNNALANGDIVIVEMTSSLTCADPVSATSNSMVISITPSGLNATIVSIGNKHRCPQTLQANPGGDVSYQWYKDGLGILGATERRYVANNNGSYSVRVTRNGCSDMSSPIDVISCPTSQPRIYTGTEFIKEGLPFIRQNGIHLYPNPASDYVSIDLQQDENANGEATVQLVTLNGQVLLTQKLHVLKGRISCKLKLNSLWKDELYLVKVIVNNRVYVGKLIKINP